MKRLTLLLAIVLSCATAFADVLTLKSGHPDSYVVKKGDTLWDISAYFLKDPWHWPKLWGSNPQIANPHLIYPGDRLTLVFIDGQPRLVVKPVIRKSPAGRVIPKGSAIPAVDLSLIAPYLKQNRVVDPEWFAQQPMMLGGESESRYHINQEVIYVNENLAYGTKYGVYTEGKTFYSRDEGELLGQEVILTASGRVIESGPVSKVRLLSNLRETKAGYRLLKIEDDSLLPAYFQPHAAKLDHDAYVLATEGGLREVGKLDIVYLDRGEVDGVTPGHVFSIFRDGQQVVINRDGVPVPPTERSSYDDFMANLSDENLIKVPDIYRGKVMVFKVFEKTSLALIMANERPVRVDDKLVSPDSADYRGD
ncbi:LysM peptidoglycan-binding domain-containing protein [Shewanella gelidii]|uniref:Peptidoglycan-binding protein LysM n=1 Tax=Shewanella gelidii TaxID=1642821 RepID=A0A917JZH4_9GAMM|nr:LysM peptidoglycan-binding domain-containing protein [Shewanella gelidii]MCL1099438.1 LysM peptidoglycan-binding domain-containing protein [Shewanella gelidii]GGI91830.1 peptidoglycan-binding protein LysM [Shewanella gelidii]